MRCFVISENDANQRLDKFISKSLPKLPKNLMYKYIRNKKIKVNKKRAEINQRLNVGDEIYFYIAEEFFDNPIDTSFFDVKGHIDVVYEDDNIIVMNKPSGLLTQSDANESIETLVNQMKLYLYETKQYDYQSELSFTPALCNRLDRNTSGLVIGAKNAKALREMNRIIKNNEICKKYITIVCNEFEGCANFVDYHFKDSNGIVKFSSTLKEGYKEIKTSISTLKKKKGYTLLEVELHTGKMHQIRIQLANHSLPLLGDVKYGGKKFGSMYQILKAYKLEFNINQESFLSYLNELVIELSIDDEINIFNKLK